MNPRRRKTDGDSQTSRFGFLLLSRRIFRTCRPRFTRVLVLWSLYRLTPQALRPKYFYWR